MTLRTSLIISGDTDGAQKAVADLAGGMQRASTSAEGLAAAERTVDAATDALEAKCRQALSTIGALNDNFIANVGAANASATAQAGAERAATGLFAAEQRLEAALSSREAAQRRATAATEADAEEQTAAAGALAAANARVAAAVIGLEKAQGAVVRAGGGVTRSLGEQQLGARMLGQQFQDMAVMGSMAGTDLVNWLRVFTSQIGQTALALEQMGAGGALGRAAAFMNTPWGAAVSGATIVLLPFVAKLFEAGEAAGFTSDWLDKAADSADSFGNAQSLLGKIIDLTTGKLKTHNTVLIETIKLQAQLNLVEAQKKINAATGFRSTGFGRFDTLPANDLRRAAGPSAQDVFAQMAEDDKVKKVAQQMYGNLLRVVDNSALANRDPSGYASLVNGQLEQGLKVLDGMAGSARATGKALGDAKAKLLELATVGTDKAAALMAIGVAGGGPVPDDLKPYAKDTKKKTPKPKSTAARDEFGRDAADRIASIAESFGDTPDVIQKADKAFRQLDDIIDDLGRKKPPNFKSLIDSAENAKKAVEDGLIRSLADGFKAPETAADKAAIALKQLDQLLSAQAQKLSAGLISQGSFDAFKGQIDKSRAVIESGLNRPYDQFIQQQQDTLAIQGLISQGRDAEAAALRTIIQLEKDRAPLTEAQKKAVLATVQAIEAEQRATEIVHDKNRKNVEALTDIKDVTMDAVRAWDRGDLGQFIKTPKKLLDAFMNLGDKKLFEKVFGDLFRELEDEVNGTTVVKDASARMAAAVDSASASIKNLGAAADQAAAGLTGSASPASKAGIVGAGSLLGSLATGGALGEEPIVSTGKALKGQMDVFSRSIGGAVEKFAGIFTSPENAKLLGKNIGEFAGKGLEGAATGTMVAGLSNALGIKMNSTGAQIGGAVGKFIPIPGGDIIGSIAGGLIGNMFTKPSYGTATLGNTSDPAKLKGRAGGEIAAGGASEQVQAGLENIAKQLGGALGDFAVSIGTFDGKWRVSTTGFSGQLDSKTAKNQGLKDFGKDGEQAAIVYAIQDAISDGAIKGLSAAVQKAIRSNSNIDKALAEALKVADLEQLLGGLPAELASAFKSFETEAADRLRIAKEYGFDIVKTEELNAKQRAALTKQLLDQQVGSLQRLIDEMTSGSMFEGTLVDRRTALLSDIDKAKADLDNNVEGAADKLAGLLEQLNGVSKDVYGTTGGFAGDRNEILDQARAAIAKANADIAKAQATGNGSDPALVTTNAALDENNDQNARILAAINETNATLARISADRGDLFDVSRLAKIG